MSPHKIKSLVRFACECNGVPDLADKISVRWNKRLRTTHGRAFRRSNLIELSAFHFTHCDDDVNEDCVVHETCHVIINNKYPHAKPHGPEWKRAMVNCGVEPNRCYNVNDKGFEAVRNYVQQKKRNRKPVVVYCKCGEHRITKNRRTRMRKGRQYICKRCKARLSFSSIRYERHK